MVEQELQNKSESFASWLGINRATVAVLIAICGLGLSEEIWRNFFGIQLFKIQHTLPAEAILAAAFYVAVNALFLNLFEGFGYIVGGTLAHKLGAGIALAASAVPMLVGFTIMMLAQQHATGDAVAGSNQSWLFVLGALLITNWEPLSVPATFDIVGAEVPKHRRTIAFAMQSIQKRVPKVLGPLIGGVAFLHGYRLNLVLAFAILAVSIILQLLLLKRMKPKVTPVHIPLREVLRNMPEDLRWLLRAEILLRWGDWFIRDFAALYVVAHLGRSPQEYGYLAAITAFAALLTYIPMGKVVDAAPSPKPYIGMTFLLFSAFPFCLVLLPKSGMPLGMALTIAFVVNGLREMGEPARKALITSGFPPEVRARAVGLYWGLRSLAFFPAPIAAYALWKYVGPDQTFLIGGCLGLLGTAVFWLRVNCKPQWSAAG